ncbi:MAG TPA: methionine biosynthesis protein MetW [Desulfurivibrionaceae bacterium]|nr:methionine biosynthesis protein MetW [Desulfurivibrionaceae bacterium]
MTPTTPLRYDLEIIASWIAPGSRVLDLGCGEGDLLLHLKNTKGVVGTGIELREEKVATALSRGLTVLQGDIREEVADYAANTFDYVIVSQTLQQVYAPVELLDTLLTIGRHVVVSFPNFSHWKNRLQLLIKGQAPRSPQLPYEWYDTPNIRVGTFADFEVLARKNGLVVTDSFGLQDGEVVRRWPNLLASVAVFRFERR